MKFINVKILLLVLLAYVLALVAFVPLARVAPVIERQLAPYGVTLNDPRGTLWHGQAIVRIDRLGYATVNWDVQGLGLLVLSFPVQVTIKNKDLAVSGRIKASLGGLAVSDLNGYVDESAAASIYNQYQATLTGRLQLRDVAADMAWSRALGDASGVVTWSGGPISFPVGNSVGAYSVPTMIGTLTSDDQQWVLQARGSNQQEYLSASIKRDGLATLSIKRLLATEMNVPVPGSGDSLFDVSQKVF